MNRNEYLAALRGALSGLPDEERASALRYYEEYLDDAGPENEARAIEELGSPQRVAAQILADYRELTTVPGAKNASQGENGSASSGQTTPKRGWRGINPWLLLVLVLLAIPIGVPLAAGVAGVIVSLLAAAVCIVLGVAVVAVALPLCLLLGGGALIVFFLFRLVESTLGSCHAWLRPCLPCARRAFRPADVQAVHPVYPPYFPRLCRHPALAV